MLAVAYLNRSTTKRTAGSAELVYLLIVLVAGIGTAWWASGKIGMDLSSLASVPRLLGVSAPSRPFSGYDARMQQAPSASTGAENANASHAPYCTPGQTPAFVVGAVELKQHLGETMGTPVECEHPASGSGDIIQQTTTGLAAYDQRSKTVTFTDGWNHWALTPSGLVTWEGTQSEPPSPSG